MINRIAHQGWLPEPCQLRCIVLYVRSPVHLTMLEVPGTPESHGSSGPRSASAFCAHVVAITAAIDC